MPAVVLSASVPSSSIYGGIAGKRGFVEMPFPDTPVKFQPRHDGRRCAAPALNRHAILPVPSVRLEQAEAGSCDVPIDR